MQHVIENISNSLKKDAKVFILFLVEVASRPTKADSNPNDAKENQYQNGNKTPK